MDIRKLFLSKWLYYSTIAVVLVLLFLYYLPLAREGNDIAANFVSEIWGLIFTLGIFIVILDFREKLEWRSVEGRVKRRIGRQIRGLFIDLSNLCDIDRVILGPFSKEKFEEMDLKQLSKLASEKVRIHDGAKKSLLKREFRMQYERLLESRAASFSRIEDTYFTFLNSDVQASLMDIQDHLDDLTYALIVQYAQRERFFEYISSSIGEIMKEINKLRKKGYWVIRD